MKKNNKISFTVKGDPLKTRKQSVRPTLVIKQKDLHKENEDDYFDELEAHRGTRLETIYSFDEVKQKTTVAVYGSLRKEMGNHRIIQHEDFVGEGTTVEKWPMLDIACGLFPALFDKIGIGHQVKCEVYEVSTKTLMNLDHLEGVANGLYFKKQIGITIEGKTVSAWVYFICQKFALPDKKYLIQDWKQYKNNLC